MMEEVIMRFPTYYEIVELSLFVTLFHRFKVVLAAFQRPFFVSRLIYTFTAFLSTATLQKILLISLFRSALKKA